jgi:hypothetical protein
LLARIFFQDFFTTKCFIAAIKLSHYKKLMCPRYRVKEKKRYHVSSYQRFKESAKRKAPRWEKRRVLKLKN